MKKTQPQLYKRVLLKLSGEVLQGEKSGIDFQVLESLCMEIKEVYKKGVEIAIMIGGGNFWRYRDSENLKIDRVHSDYMGMTATIINALALLNTFKFMGVDARVLSPFSMPVTEEYKRDKALKYLEEGKIIIFAGGTGNPFFTTDTAAALRALEVNCQVLLKATKVDYVYDRDPKKYRNAQIFKNLSYQEVLERKLQVMDLSAISLCSDNKLPIVVFNLTKKGNIAQAVKGGKNSPGTYIS